MTSDERRIAFGQSIRRRLLIFLLPP